MFGNTIVLPLHLHYLHCYKNIVNKHYDNNSDKRLSIISLSSIEMCIHLIWYYKDVNKSGFVEVVKSEKWEVSRSEYDPSDCRI